MSLLVPLGLVLGLTLPAVIVFYLLKVRRHDAEVSSTFLWNDLVRDLAAHEPLQKLKWNVLLVLQLLALALLTLAFARPSVLYTGDAPVHAVLVLDASASMQASDAGGSRFASAVADARSTVTQLPENSVTTVILAAAHPQVLIAASGDRRLVDRVLAQDAHPSGASGDMREALLLARSLGGDPGARRIHVYTDGAFTLPLDLPEDLGSVAVDQVGQTETGNVAITAVSTRPDPRDARRQQLFFRAENLGTAPVQARLAVNVDGTAVDERTLDLAPNAASDQVVEDLPTGARAASVSVVAPNASNALALDDNGYAVLSQRKPTQVLLVSQGNPFLEKVLSLLPNVELYRILSRRYLAVEADRFDVVVFDDYLPPLLPRGNLLIINPPDRGAIATNGTLTRPKVAGWERDDPLLAYVDLRDLAVNKAKRLEPQRWARPLITTPDGSPLLVVGQDGDRHLAVVPFSLSDSNLPLAPAFPILVSNLLGYLSPTGVVQTPAIQTGDAETLIPLPQVQSLQVTGPNNAMLEMKTGQGALTYASTDTPGLYRVQQIVQSGGQTVDEDLFAANLADPQESDIRPRLQGLASNQVDTSIGVPLNREVWWLVAALALPLLLFEWFWFHRRV